MDTSKLMRMTKGTSTKMFDYGYQQKDDQEYHHKDGYGRQLKYDHGSRRSGHGSLQKDGHQHSNG